MCDFLSIIHYKNFTYMKLFLFLLSITFSSISFTQETSDVVDSVHRYVIFNGGISKLQNWQTRLTRSNENISALSGLIGNVSLKLDSVVIPFDGYMTSRYGQRWGVFHPGVDIALRTGDTVRSAWDGVVRYAMMNRGGYGNLVIVRHRNGLETYYAHLSKICVSSGQKVRAGELLGLGGNTGHSYGAHLHFEVRFYDVCINPELLVNFVEKELVSKSFSITSDLILGRVSVPTGVLSDEFESVEFVAGVVLPISGKLTSNSTPVHMRKYYIVKKGDCLNRIAEINDVTVQDLCRLNKIDELKLLMVGQRLRIR